MSTALQAIIPNCSIHWRVKVTFIPKKRNDNIWTFWFWKTGSYPFLRAVRCISCREFRFVVVSSYCKPPHDRRWQDQPSTDNLRYLRLGCTPPRTKTTMPEYCRRHDVVFCRLGATSTPGITRCLDKGQVYKRMSWLRVQMTPATNPSAHVLS